MMLTLIEFLIFFVMIIIIIKLVSTLPITIEIMKIIMIIKLIGLIINSDQIRATLNADKITDVFVLIIIIEMWQ